MGAVKKHSLKERDALSWNPVRKGDIFCSPGCGGGCTWSDYVLMHEHGRRAAAELGPSWTVEVYENLGWYVAVHSPCKRIKVHINFVSGTWMGTLPTYHAFVGEPGSPGGKWVGHGDTPKEAVDQAVAQAKAELAELSELLKGL